MAFMVMAAKINFSDCNLYPYILVYFLVNHIYIYFFWETGKPYILVINIELAAIVPSNFLRS